MYDRPFFRTPLGRASIASVAAMLVFVVLSSHLGSVQPPATVAGVHFVELA